MFGDLEPEDSWDRGDPPGVLADNLRRRARLLYVNRAAPWLDTLADIALAVVIARARDDLTPRDMTRIADLFDDLAWLAERTGPGGG
jgi:hypothetical protein